MSSKILESDEVDSKYFRQAFGRLLTNQNEQRALLEQIIGFLEGRFFLPPKDTGRTSESEEHDEDELDYDE